MLESVLGSIDIDDAVFHRLAAGKTAASPGMKYKHYAPSAQVILLKGDFAAYRAFLAAHKEPGTVALCFDGEETALPVPAVSYGAATDSAAQGQRLFEALRELDKQGAKTVYARFPSQDGFGLAVFNRLIRAAAFRVIEL